MIIQLSSHQNRYLTHHKNFIGCLYTEIISLGISLYSLYRRYVREIEDTRAVLVSEIILGIHRDIYSPFLSCEGGEDTYFYQFTRVWSVR